MSNPENADVELILIPPRLRGGWPSDSEVGWGPPARSIEESKKEPHPALPENGEGKDYNGADAVLSDGRYCIGSTGAEFLRISKWSCGFAAVPVCPDFAMTWPRWT